MGSIIVFWNRNLGIFKSGLLIGKKIIQEITSAMLVPKAKNIFSNIKLRLFIVEIASFSFDAIFKLPDLKKSSQVSTRKRTKKQ
jgi:hypothetical protein